MRGASQPARTARGRRRVYVYEAPVRLWHWVNALCMVTLCASGFLIAAPVWPGPPGEASDHFVMGYVRFVHFACGYVFATAFVGRVYWAFAGNRHARQLFLLPWANRSWWREVWEQCRWYAFRLPSPKPYLEHDPLAQLVMYLTFMVPTVFMIGTGFALYGEGAGAGSWQERLFGWLLPLLGQSQQVHTWHHLGMWILIVFSIIHVYAAVREDLVSGRSILDAMISGYRTLPSEPQSHREEIDQ